jgi:predicted aspartyl protease
VRTSPLALAILAGVCLSAPDDHAAGAAPAALKTFLEREGYGGAQLHRLGNYLSVTTVINGRRTGLLVDTGSPFTIIDSASTRAIGLQERQTGGHITGITGVSEHAGRADIASLQMGNCTFLNVPVVVAETAGIHSIRGANLSGFFGAHEMSKFGAVIDCARQMIYVNPRGQSAAANENLAQFLAGRGFTRMPMRLDPTNHLQVEIRLNGHPVAMMVDTGAWATFVPAAVALASGASTTGLNFAMRGATAGRLPAKVARVQELSLGNLVVRNAEVTIGEARVGAAGLLGEEYLSWNFGIIDLGGMNLYLRPPEASSTGKKR